jgi:putative ABC transport system permease protein
LLRDFSKPVVIANIVAWPFAFVLERVYLNLFTTRVAISPWPFVVSFAITLGIALVSVAEQARRAAAVKPVQVLQAE